MERRATMRRLISRTVLASLCGVFILVMPLGVGWGQEEGVTDTTVKIGSINDTTGGLAAYGNTRVEAHKALINHINDQGGINGRKLIYINESDNYEPTKTVLAFKKLMEVDKVFCMASVLGVTNTMAIAPEVQSRKIPYLMIGGNSSKLFFPPQRYIFGIWPTYEHFQQIILDFIADELKMPNAKIAHIHQDTESGRDSVRGYGTLILPKYPGMKLVAREAFKYGTLGL
jgi:branched-chain amino acid transport system substrate-binding protein